MESEVLRTTKLLQKRENHTSQVIDGDKVVIAGGWNGNQSLKSCEIFQYDQKLDTLISYQDKDELMQMNL